MKRYATLIAAAALVLIADGFAFLHAYRNRTGPGDAAVILTENELVWLPNSDDSGVLLTLRTWQDMGPTPLIGRDALAHLGFDVSRDPAESKASEFYYRQGPRRVWAVLELSESAPIDPDGKPVADASRLAYIEAGLSPAPLRGRYPDRGRYLILPARLQAHVRPESKKPAYRPAQLDGDLYGFHIEVHVSKPWSDLFRAHRNDRGLAYRVRLRTGSLYEPFVDGVEFGSNR